MSLGYAEKLSYVEDVGQVGMTEFFDRSARLEEKIEKLASMIKKSKHLVAFTGAGVSTSSGIPDFRGPKGIWTLQRKGEALPESSLPFHRAMPTITHMALVELEKAGILKFVISQNVDGLHLRSGIPREKLAELHGNSFMEVCASCGTEYLRDFEVETIGLKETSRCCSRAKCRARLRDTVLDWEDVLPPKEINKAEKHCKMADMVLCLGTSLQITPACDLPLKCLRGGGKIVIVNLQKTPKDRKASLVIHGLVDKVIGGVLRLFNLHIPPYVRIDFLEVALTPALSVDEKIVYWNLRISSIHGRKAPLPFIESVKVTFSGCDNPSFNVLLHEEPYVLTWISMNTDPSDVALRLTFGEGCACASSEIKIQYHLKASVHDLNLDKQAVLRGLIDSAIKDPSCGQNALVECNMSSGETKISAYAFVTNIAHYSIASALEEDHKMLNEQHNGIRKSCKRRRRR